MRICEWCGKPIPESEHGKRKYHIGECAYNADALNRVFLRHRGIPENVSTHEYVWHYLFSRLNEADQDIELNGALALKEWELMMNVIKAFDEEPTTRPDTGRLEQLAAIGEELLAMPMTTRWKDVPARIRKRIAWYVSEPTKWWKNHPKAILPRTERDRENQARKKCR